MIGAPPPGGAPPGAAPKWTRPGEDPGDVWAMDYGKGRWIAPDEDKSSKRGHLAMPPGWSPRDLKQHPWSVVLSPPGTPPPPNTYTYTPSTREINAPGSAPSRDDRDALTLSFMPGGPPPGSPGAGTPTPPPGPVPGGQPGAGPPMPGRPGPGQPPGPGRPPGPPPPPPGGPGMPPPGMPSPGMPPPGMPPPGMPPPPGPPGGSPPGMGGAPSPPMQPPGPLPPGGGMPPRPPAPPPGMGPPMGAPAGPGAGVSPGPMPSGPGAAPPPAPPNPGMAMGQGRPPPPAPRPPPAPEHQDPDSMVAALLRALGFEDDAAPAGEGQDRAPVGHGQDRVGVGAAGPPTGAPALVEGISQNQLPLSPQEAAAACGPAAALFMTRMGRQPTAQEAQQLRQMAVDVGWTPGRGMNGPSGFVSLARRLGVEVEQGPVDPTRIVNDATAGLPVVISTAQGRTPGHYWQISDYDANTGKFLMGDAVGGRQGEMTLDQIQNHGSYGGPMTALYVAGASRAIDRPPSAMAQGASAPGSPMQLMSSQGAQGAPPGQPAPGPASVQRIAMNAGASPDLAEIMAAGAKTESGANPQAVGDGGHSVGLWQMHDQGEGAGMTHEQRADPSTAAQRMVPAYQQAYERGQRQGYHDVELAVYTYLHAERPQNQSIHGAPAETMRANYAEVTAQSARGQELQIGGGYAPPSGASGQQNAGGSPNLLQQAWAQAQPAIQQLMSTAQGAASAVGDRVASLGATPAYAEPSPPAAGPPPGPTPQVQQPSPERDQQARDAAAERETALAQGRQQEMDAGVAAAGTALSQPVLSWRVGPQASPTPGPTATPSAPAGAPPPTAYPGGFAAAASTAAGPPRPVIQPQQPPPTDIPRPSTAGGPATAEPTGPPPAPAGLPPDTETQHWDNNILAWVPKNPPADFGSAGGRYRLPAGVQPVTDANGNPAPNPPGTPVEYVPNQPGPYPQGYFDGANWHAPTAASQQTPGTPAQPLAPGLSFVPSAPNSRSGTAYWEDPNTHQVTSAPYTLGDPMPPGLGTAGQAPQSPLQEAQTAQSRAQTQALQNSQRIPVEVAGQLYDPQTGANLGPAPQTPLAAVQTATAQRSLNTPVESGGVMYDRDGNPIGPPTQSPLAAAQTSQANRSLNTPIESGGVMYDQYGNAIGPPTQSPLAQAQTQREQLGNTAPITVGNLRYRPTRNPDTGELSYGEGEPIPLSASEQANLDEKQREFGTLSAYQKSQADESKASLAQNESQFQQSLSERQAESNRPYQQMTKAEQAQDARAQQELGLKKEQLGFQENESANKLEQLPRGGITRVNPYTGQIELVNAPEPEDIRMVGSQIYIPGGRQVSMLGQQISGGPNPYAGVPSGQGAPFRYPGGSGGGGQSFGAGGWGGGGMSGGQGGGGYQWQQPRQQQGWG